MKVLVIGSGGREYAFAKKIADSPLVNEVICAPGNDGMVFLPRVSVCDVKANDIQGLLKFALKNEIDLTIVGPEDPLVNGIVNAFEDKKLVIFGPTKEAAKLEGSKVYSKKFMEKYGISTAPFTVFENTDAIKEYLPSLVNVPGIFPFVLKVDELAAGKGARICKSMQDALNFIKEINDGNIKGAGGKIIKEKFVAGEEGSCIAVVSKNGSFYLLPFSQDHKAVFNNDKGPNTGGMGAYSPAPVVTRRIEEKVREIIRRTIDGMREESRPFCGFLYAGIIVDKNEEVQVLEYNVRMGDPETQPIMARLKSDLIPLILAALDNNLDEYGNEVKWDSNPAVCVVGAAKGYPGAPQKGDVIRGIIEAERAGAAVSLAGVVFDEKGDLATSGGRVLGVTALGDFEGDFLGAKNKAYKALKKIFFKGMHYRTDIADKAINRKIA